MWESHGETCRQTLNQTCENGRTPISIWDELEAGQLPERVARSVIKTTVSLPSYKQARSIGSQCRPSQTNPSAKRRRTSPVSPAWNTRRFHWGRLHDASQTKRTTAVQHRVRADGWSLRGRPTPSPQGVGRGGVRADTPKLTVKRPPSYASDSNHLATTQTARDRAGALTFPSSCLDGGVTRVGPGQYPQYTRADFGLEAVGSSVHKHHTSPNVKPHGRVKWSRRPEIIQTMLSSGFEAYR